MNIATPTAKEATNGAQTMPAYATDNGNGTVTLSITIPTTDAKISAKGNGVLIFNQRKERIPVDGLNVDGCEAPRVIGLCIYAPFDKKQG